MQSNHKGHKIKAILLSTLIFLCGGVTGAAIYSSVSAKPDTPPRKPWSKPKDFYGSITDRICSKYAVPAEDKQKIEAILKSGGEKLNALKEDMRPKVSAIYQQISKEIRSVIPEGKQAEFDKDNERRKDSLPPMFFHSRKHRRSPSDKDRKSPPPSKDGDKDHAPRPSDNSGDKDGNPPPPPPGD